MITAYAREPHTQGRPRPVPGPRGWVRGCTATEGVTLALVTWVYRCHFSSCSRNKGSTLENDCPQLADMK